MTAEEHIHSAKTKPKISKEELKRARITALVLALSIILSIVFLVFAFPQKSEAEKFKSEVLKTQKLLMECQAAHE